MTALLAPLQYDFMIKALISAAAVGGVCALLSVYLMLKGWSLVGDALSHAVVPGVALAYLWKLPYALGAFTTGILAAAAMLILKRLPMLRQDAIIGLVFTTFFAAGLFIISLYPTAINLQAVIYGNILGIDDHDLWQMLAICAVSLIILAAKWRDLMLYFFDDIQAVTAGLPVARLRWTFFLLVSAAGATAFLLCRSFGKVLITAFAIGVSTDVIGTYASYFLDSITGAVIVVLQGGLFLAVFAVRRLQHLARLRHEPHP